MFIICGLDELAGCSTTSISHVLSITDPGLPDPEAFTHYHPHRRAIVKFHDLIEMRHGHIEPKQDHVEQILAFGSSFSEASASNGGTVLLVHCHLGISRSTAAVAAILAHANPGLDADQIFRQIEAQRPQAWPNSKIVTLADHMLEREGELVQAMRKLYGRRLSSCPTLADDMRSYGRGQEVDMAVAP